jgi:hypothetical protein
MVIFVEFGFGSVREDDAGVVTVGTGVEYGVGRWRPKRGCLERWWSVSDTQNW